MEQEPQTPRERALVLIKLLVGVESNWQPTFCHYLWGIRIVIAATVLAFVIASMGDWLWGILADYVKPKTATQRKDLANIFVVIVVGAVGTVTAIVALGNLYISRKNLQNARDTLRQQRELDEDRAQDDALQSYLEHIGKLLSEQKLAETESEDDPLRLLAQAQTLTVLARLDGTRNGSVVRFLHGARLIVMDEEAILHLKFADMRGAVLKEADLREADLERAYLSRAYLRRANLCGADLRESYLHDTNLSGADLSGANLSRAWLEGTDLSGTDLSGANLSDAYEATDPIHGSRRLIANAVIEKQAAWLEGATMPNGQKYEDWLKGRERHKEEG